MKIMQNKKYLAIDLTFAVLAVGLFLILGRFIINVMAPFVYALVLSYLLDPVVKFMEKRKIKRIWAIIIIFLSMIVIISLLFMSFIPQLVEDVTVLVREIPGIFSFVEQFVADIKSGESDFFPALMPEGLYDFLDLDSQFERISTWLSNSLSQFTSALVESTKSLLNIIMTPLITFYYLKDKEKFFGGAMGRLSENTKLRLTDIGSRIDKVFGGFIKGQVLIAAFVGILTGIGCRLIGVPYSLTIGLVAGVTNIIPYFGPWLGGILPVILALMNAPLTALWVVLLIVVIQQVESAFISPQVMSHSVGLHPLSVMFSVLLFGNAMGIPGMILGVPITGTIKVMYNYFLEFRREVRTNDILDSDSQ
ncbi:AI-2E family transporter [Alkalibacter saccharofermentans]|uniref:Predicted PurR-regulated permease PerM n=1 Tax=Alkalibacter saccharofermentans DSM 14828 TaxID=1120975 RepID=A0A1M4S7Y5_9FIRM|nr:AI-2E family transporter [Alkalibacter saccharofermentans]SHE28147.1 Predicted PurR-regulated permease PerM [Alkalibacter saccharofermentans DSM 14828]